MLHIRSQLQNLAFGRRPVASFAAVFAGRALSNEPRPAVERVFGGDGTFECTICHHSPRRFTPTHRPGRLSCPLCGALDRDRFHELILRRKTSLFCGTPRSLLHIAPEPSLVPVFEATPGLRYVTGDLMRPNVTAKVDITRMQFRDNEFDHAFCSHVLEHVPDDHSAMAEFARVVRPEGTILFAFPEHTSPTIEDPELTDRRARIRRFGQIDHLRIYGPDVVERFEAAGLRSEAITPASLCTPEEVRRFGLNGSTPLSAYLCSPVRSQSGLPNPDITTYLQ